MRNIIFILVFLISTQIWAQNNLQTAFINNWKMTDITELDGSPFYDEEMRDFIFDLKVTSGESLELFNSNRLNKLSYRLRPDSVLTLAGLRLKIVEISDIKMILEASQSQGYDFKMTFTPKKLYDLTYTPSAYKAKNGDVVFEAIAGSLEPKFIHKTMSPIDYIFEKFGYPEYRKGGFVVRFVVTNTGELAGVRVVASSNNRYNDRLVKAVMATKGMWQPAEFKGEKVSTEVEYDFNLNYNDRQITSIVDSTEYSKQYYQYGMELLNRGAYKNASNYFEKAIEYNPLNVNAYFKHAEVSFALRRKEEGCRSLTYLILLEQKKAQPLYDKNCK